MSKLSLQDKDSLVLLLNVKAAVAALDPKNSLEEKFVKRLDPLPPKRARKDPKLEDEYLFDPKISARAQAESSAGRGKDRDLLAEPPASKLKKEEEEKDKLKKEEAALAKPSASKLKKEKEEEEKNKLKREEAALAKPSASKLKKEKEEEEKNKLKKKEKEEEEKNKLKKEKEEAALAKPSASKLKKEEEKDKSKLKKEEKEEKSKAGLPSANFKITLFKVPSSPFVSPSEAGLVQLPTADLAFKPSEVEASSRSSLSVAGTKAESSKRSIIDSLVIARLNSGRGGGTSQFYDVKFLASICKDLGIKGISRKAERVEAILDEIIMHGSDKQRKEAEKRKSEEAVKAKK